MGFAVAFRPEKGGAPCHFSGWFLRAGSFPAADHEHPGAKDVVSDTIPMLLGNMCDLAREHPDAACQKRDHPDHLSGVYDKTEPNEVKFWLKRPHQGGAASQRP